MRSAVATGEETDRAHTRTPRRRKQRPRAEDDTLRTGYLSLIGGASGDMLLAAILDAGVDPAALTGELRKLDLPEHRIEVRPERRGGVQGTHVSVRFENESGPPKGWAEFAALIETSSLSPRVRGRSLTVLRMLEEAERRAHRVAADAPAEPLHELGSFDTVVDIAGTVAGLELLEIERLHASPLPLGGGVISTGHGPLPAASPATLELVSMAHAPVTPPPAGVTGELVTPTGAALITVLAEFGQPPLRLERVGYGLGTRDTPAVPNVVALWVGETDVAPRRLTLLETNIDDSSPEVIGYAQEQLFALGALDVWLTPIQMKKNRPGVVLSALVPSALEAKATDLILRETTTLGVRRRDVERHEAERETQQVETSLGWVSVKVKRLSGRPVALSPEYEACRAIALERGLPLQHVLAVVQREAGEQLLGVSPDPG